MGAKPSLQREPYIASIAMEPHCSCPDFLKNGNSGPCKHLIWLYIFVFKVNEEVPLLQQKSLTSEELTLLLADYKIEERYICSEKRPPSRFEECKKLLREDDRFADYSHEWKLMKKKKKRGRAPQCQTCKTSIQENMSCLLCRALYVPYEQHFVREKDFYFCPLKSCIKALPFYTNLTQPDKILVSGNVSLIEKQSAIKEGLPVL